MTPFCVVSTVSVIDSLSRNFYQIDKYKAGGIDLQFSYMAVTM